MAKSAADEIWAIRLACSLLSSNVNIQAYGTVTLSFVLCGCIVCERWWWVGIVEGIIQNGNVDREESL